jgi:hypothetical protein
MLIGQSRKQSRNSKSRTLSRDNLGENCGGNGNQSLKRAAGSEVMIISVVELGKRFFSVWWFDCRGAAISAFP